jgi:hypothetical protein
VYVHGGTSEGFWSMIAGGAHQQRNGIRTPSSKYVTFVQVDFWENERDKDNQHGVELALLGFDCQAANRPHSGCYLSMLSTFLKPGITRNPKHLLAGTSLGLNI